MSRLRQAHLAPDRRPDRRSAAGVGRRNEAGDHGAGRSRAQGGASRAPREAHARGIHADTRRRRGSRARGGTLPREDEETHDRGRRRPAQGEGGRRTPARRFGRDRRGGRRGRHPRAPGRRGVALQPRILLPVLRQEPRRDQPAHVLLQLPVRGLPRVPRARHADRLRARARRSRSLPRRRRGRARAGGRAQGELVPLPARGARGEIRLLARYSFRIAPAPDAGRHPRRERRGDHGQIRLRAREGRIPHDVGGNRSQPAPPLSPDEIGGDPPLDRNLHDVAPVRVVQTARGSGPRAFP